MHFYYVFKFLNKFLAKCKKREKEPSHLNSEKTFFKLINPKISQFTKINRICESNNTSWNFFQNHLYHLR